MQWLRNKKLAYWIGAGYLLSILYTVVVWGVSRPSQGEFLAAYGSTGNFLLVWHLSFVATAILIILLYSICRLLGRRIRSLYRNSTKDSRLLKTKRLFDAGVLTEAEYQDRLAAIKE